MRTTIGNFDYLQNYEDIIDVFSYDGVKDELIGRFMKIGNNVHSEMSITNPHYIEIYGNAVKIFTGEITVL